MVQRVPMKQEIVISISKKTIAMFVAAIIVAGITLGGYFLWKNKSSAPLGDRTYSGIIVKSSLPKETIEQTVAFIHDAVKKEYVPGQLELRQARKSPNADTYEYLGVWNKKDYVLSVLSVVGAKEKDLRYVRTWIFYPGESVTDATAKTYISTVFTGAYASLSKDMSCQKGQDPETKSQMTICSAMSEDRQDRQGVLVRAPMILPNDQKMVMAAACMVPADEVENYPAPHCL
jgi:hypothetical protein